MSKEDAVISKDYVIVWKKMQVSIDDAVMLKKLYFV